MAAPFSRMMREVLPMYTYKNFLRRHTIRESRRLCSSRNIDVGCCQRYTNIDHMEKFLTEILPRPSTPTLARPATRKSGVLDPGLHKCSVRVVQPASHEAPLSKCQVKYLDFNWYVSNDLHWGPRCEAQNPNFERRRLRRLLPPCVWRHKKSGFIRKFLSIPLLFMSPIVWRIPLS